MSFIYKENDVALLKENINNILEQVEDKKGILLEPFISEIKEITNIILQFIRERKRKIYGGYAINLLIKNVNPQDAIYKDKENPDIDFYTPEPVKDLIDLCNILFDKGYKFVRGYEAQHKETYSIRVNNHLYCDLSYVPKNIYNKIPFKIIDELYIIHPNWYMIDFYRMLTDPLTSYWRIDKHFERFYLIQKYYPLAHIDKSIFFKFPKEDINLIFKSLDIIHNFLEENENTITIGIYAYNHFLVESGILKKDKNNRNKNKNKFNILQVPYYEIISTNYKNDCLNLISKLKAETDLTNNISVVEHYPFFQFNGYSAHIYYRDDLIAILYHYNNKCLPYIKVPSDKYLNKQIIKGNSFINIGTFPLTILYAFITVMKARTDDNIEVKDLYFTIISHLIEFRTYYFKKTGKNMLSDSLFKDFILDCKGQAITPEKERALIIESRKKKKQKILFAYDPAENKLENNDISYVFVNSSGNPIKNPKNLKLTENIDNDEESIDNENDLELKTNEENLNLDENNLEMNLNKDESNLEKNLNKSRNN